MNGKYTSSKLVQGFSTCFRQWRAKETHCSFLHGYAIEILFNWESDYLDHRNWVVDFGGFKRSEFKIENRNPNDYLKWLLDHTVLVSEDDPMLYLLKDLEKENALQLRILPSVGCEKLAELLFEKFSKWTHEETKGRVTLTEVTVKENQNNFASYRLHKDN
jgi:6-pyruvoyltetrahydropterin/6-carboxytetrahydropterin synthase